MYRVRLALCGFLFFLIYSEQGVCALERDFQSWLNATVTGSFSKTGQPPSHFKYWLEGQQRFGDDSSRLTQTMLRPGLGYSVTKNLSLWLGYAWVYTGHPLTTRPFEEDRIWQQLLWVKKNQYLTLTSRTRTEQRFLENNPKTAYRIRELIKISIPWSFDSKFSVVSSNELFWHKNNFVGTNSSGFDQNRLFLGLGYKVNPIVTTEFGYMNQYIRRFGVPNFLANILSVNFICSMDNA